ncbi:MAG: hypothetical protein WD226_08910 [Planctomycetota bacterium]
MDDNGKQEVAAVHPAPREASAFGWPDTEVDAVALEDALCAVELGRRKLVLVRLARNCAAPGALTLALLARPRLAVVGEVWSTSQVRLWTVARGAQRRASERGTRTAALLGPVYGARTLKTLRMELQSRGARRFSVIDRSGGAGETFLVEFDHPDGTGARLLGESARFAQVRALGTWQPVGAPVLAG